MSDVNHKLIAKNTILLYCRMAFSMCISLYTSRIILDALGIADYGLQAAITGIVGLVTWMANSMSGTSSRFIAYARGIESVQRIQVIFNTSLFLHLILAILTVAAIETFGIYYIQHKLVYPIERHAAVMFILHTSACCVFLSIIQVPFVATIIAYERMILFAYIEISNVMLKLLLACILTVYSGDKLIAYGSFSALSGLILFVIYYLFVRTNFHFSGFCLPIDRKSLKEMLSFSFYDVYGSLCGTLKAQGITLLFNAHFGPLVNSAASVANLLAGSLSSLSNNATAAVRPQIIKQYAQNNVDLSLSVCRRGIILTSSLLLIPALPFALEIDFILKLWLVEVPAHTAQMVRIAVILSTLGNISTILAIPCQATGNIRYISFSVGTLFLINYAVVYIMLRSSLSSPTLPYVINAIFNFLILIAECLIVKRQIPIFKPWTLCRQTVFPILLLYAISYLLFQEALSHFTQGALRFCIISPLASIWIASLFYLILLSKSERTLVTQYIKQKLTFK